MHGARPYEFIGFGAMYFTKLLRIYRAWGMDVTNTYEFIGFGALDAPTTIKDPAGNLRFQPGFGPKVGPHQAQNIQHGAHKPVHNDSEPFWADFGVFRPRSETFELRDSSAEFLGRKPSTAHWSQFRCRSFCPGPPPGP